MPIKVKLQRGYHWDSFTPEKRALASLTARALAGEAGSHTRNILGNLPIWLELQAEVNAAAEMVVVEYTARSRR